MKVAIGVIDHHSLQVERPEEVAAHIRMALEHIPLERLVLSSDCGMGREGMARRHALYKMISLVQGTNMVRREHGIPEAECIAADANLTLLSVTPAPAASKRAANKKTAPKKAAKKASAKRSAKKTPSKKKAASKRKGNRK